MAALTGRGAADTSRGMASPAETAAPSPWLSLPAVAAIVLVLAAVRLAVGAHLGLSFDESYYTDWSTSLQVGYLDHPPAVAWLIAAGRALAGNNELGMRLFAVLCGLGTTAALYRLGVLLANRSVAGLAALLYNLTPVMGLGFITTPDPPSALFWTATLWAVAEFMVSERAAWWLLAGVFAGLGLWSKYTDAFLAPGLLLFVLADGARWRWLVRWPIWAAAALALIVFAPVIWWNAQRKWASFRFQGQRTVTTGIDPNWGGNLIDLLAGQALYLGPILLLCALFGILAFLYRPADSRRSGLALPVWSSLPLIAYFVFHAFHAHVEANWLIPIGPSLALAGAWMALGLWRRIFWLGGATIGLQMLIGLVITVAIYAQALWQPFDFGGPDRTATETRGWSKLRYDIASVATANGARWIATSGNFGLTGELASYFLFAGSKLPVREVNEPERWEFAPPLDATTLAMPALFVTPATALPDGLFAQGRKVGEVVRDGGRWPLEKYTLFLVSEPSATVAKNLGR